jgi:hypothetical protein
MVENDLTDLDDILKDRIATLESDRDRAKEALARINIHPKPNAFDAEAIERFGQIMRQPYPDPLPVRTRVFAGRRRRCADHRPGFLG